MTDKALVKWNDQEKRWELWIDGVFKAYTTPEGSEKDLVDLAEGKGYTVELQE